MGPLAKPVLAQAQASCRILGLDPGSLRTGYGLIDCQMHTTHLESLGAREIPRAEFARRVKDLVDYPRPPGRWLQEAPNSVNSGTEIAPVCIAPNRQT